MGRGRGRGAETFYVETQDGRVQCTTAKHRQDTKLLLRPVFPRVHVEDIGVALGTRETNNNTPLIDKSLEKERENRDTDLSANKIMRDL